MNPAQVMPHTDGDPVVALVPAAARAVQQMVIVQVAPRRTNRDGAPPTVTREDGVTMPRL